MGVDLGVKALVDAGRSEVPSEYFQERDEMQQDEGVEIPVVDLSRTEEQVIQEVRSACQEWGFFQVIGHGFPQELMSKMCQLVHGFFDLPADERLPYYSMDFTKGFRCGTSFNPQIEKVKQWNDYMYQLCSPPARDDELPSVLDYPEISREYGKEIDLLARRLLVIFSQSLGLEKDALLKVVASPPRLAIRMNYYPPCPSPAAVCGITRHSDPGGFTILQQDTGIEGLQVVKDGKWVTVKPIAGGFVINIADQLQILTNGRYRSVEHRAMVNATKTRVSIASFYSPGDNTVVAPIQELLDADEAPKYKACTFGEYLNSFFNKKLEGKTALEKVA